MSSYLVFQELDVSHNIKTKKLRVISNTTLTILGEIRFYAQWRKYIFEPSNAIFDSKCLTEIVTFLDSLMLERKTNAPKRSSS